jgi:hypothetical protein
MLPEVKNLFRPLTLFIAVLHAVYMLAGCGADDDIEEEVPPVKIVSVDPPSGNTIAVDAIITATFDGVLADVIVSHGVAPVTGKTLTISGPFTQGTFTLIITWSDGTQPLIYTVLDTEAPKIICSSIKDGDTSLTTLALNKLEDIEIEFNEKVTGHVALQTEDGEDVGWWGRVEGTKATIVLIKGKEIIDCETTFIIVGKVSDAAGNSTDFKVTFTTAGWPDDWTCVHGIWVPEDDP